MQVDSDEHFSRIGGTATGGGTFWGLGKLLTSAKVLIIIWRLWKYGHRRVVSIVK